MGLSVGRAVGHTWGFTLTTPDSHLDSKPQVHVWMLFSLPLGGNLGLCLVVGLQELLCVCVALLQLSLDNSWDGP